VEVTVATVGGEENPQVAHAVAHVVQTGPPHGGGEPLQTCDPQASTVVQDIVVLALIQSPKIVA
jgi:hypothetical protein